jgi:DNA (cytosine-5)-methyltransferase 1
VGSLFTGYSGLDMAVRTVLGGQLAWVSDIDPGANALLAHRHPDVPNLGDVTAVDWSQVEPVDVLVGGFPCQDVSLAGRREGLGPGTRSGLWWQFAYAIERLRPRLVVIENVRGLLSARGAPPTPELLAAWAERDRCRQALHYLNPAVDRVRRSRNKELKHRVQAARRRYLGRLRTAVAAAKRADALIVRAIGTVLGELARLGFDARWCGLRAADVGAPHGRFRVFIVAFPSVARGVAPNPAGDGRDERRAEPAGVKRGPDAAVGGAQPAPHADSVGRERPGTARNGSTGPAYDSEPASDADGAGREGPEPARGRNLPARSADPAWGDYGPAIRRWEHALGRPAPAPTVPGRSGPVLSPHFVEWLMGLPEGWVCDVPGLTRNQMLRLLGNGVVPQQGAAALEFLLADLPAVLRPLIRSTAAAAA